MKRFLPSVFILLCSFALASFLGTQARAAELCCCQPPTFGSTKASCGKVEVRVGDSCANAIPGGYQSSNSESQDPSIGCGPTITSTDPEPVYFTPQVTIDTTFKKNEPVLVNPKTLGLYIAALYRFFAGVIGVIAAFMVLYGGFKWITAGGNASRVQDAKDNIYSAIIAIVLTLGSYLLLYVINPQLVTIVDLTSLIGSRISRIEQSHEPLVPDDAEPEAFITDPSLKSAAKVYQDAECPQNAAEASKPFAVYLTGYYKPDWGATGGYESWACNLATQCWCDQLDPANTLPYCRDKKGKVYNYRPCTLAWLDAHETNDNYCTGTAADKNTPPVGPYGATGSSADGTFTAAAGAGCFGFGTTFRLLVGEGQKARSGDATIAFQDGVVWKVTDRGAKKIIRGRHIDLFFGKGEGQARRGALGVTGTATLQVLTYCPPGTKPGTACPTVGK